MPPQHWIVAMGGGGFSMEPENPRLDDFILSLSRASRPAVCFLPTASGDDDGYIVRFYTSFTFARCRPTHLKLHGRTVEDLRALLLEQDVIYVGGGATANMLAVWRMHGVDQILKDAWDRGVILCGVSAGAMCWFEGGPTDSFGRTLKPLRDGLGLLPGSFCPHYDGDHQRRPTYQHLVAGGELPPGVAADNSVGLVYRGQDLAEIISSRPDARAWRVERAGSVAVETELVPRLL